MFKGIEYKDDVDPRDILKVSPLLIAVLGYVTQYCFENNLPMVITSIIRKPNDGISKSTTHQDGRAFDLRLNNWNIGQIIKLEEYLKETCFDLGAISKETGEPRVIHVHGDGNWLHAHMQVRRTDVHPSRTTKAPTS